MKLRSYFLNPWLAAWLGCVPLLPAQHTSPAPEGVQGIQGVKQEAVQNIKNVENGVTPAPQAEPQGVNKINGVNARGQSTTASVPPPPPPPNNPPPTAVPPPPTTATATPPPPPPPASVTAPPPPQVVSSAGGTATPAGGGAVGTAARIQAVQGVSGLSAPKLQNLEAALMIKDGATGTGTKKDGKGRAAAAGLLNAPLGKPAEAPKEDGRAGFQEFEKLQNSGS